MIDLILATADLHHLVAARHYTADHLHIPVKEATSAVAVAYVCRHFEQGDYSGWDGFVEMLDADARSIAQHKESRA